jgi:chromosome partitioning protein
MFKIAISNQKGGAGKTSSTLGSAGALSLLGKRTLVIDLDPQANATTGLGFEPGEEQLTIKDFFNEPKNHPLTQTIYETTWPNVWVAPATIRLSLTADLLYGRPRREDILDRALKSLDGRDAYDVVLMDCPPSFNVMTQNAIVAADLVVVPVKYEARSPEALTDTNEVIATLRGEEFQAWRILRLGRDARKTLTNETIEERLKPWRSKFLKTIIPVDEGANQSQMARVSLHSYSAGSPAEVAYRTLAEELLKYGR